MKRLQPQIDALINAQSETVLTLQRRNEIAYANITLLLESTSSSGVSSLSRVSLKKVAVTEWYAEHTDWKRKGISLAALGERAAGLSGVLSTYSEAVSLHPDLVDEAAERIETRLQELEREVAGIFSPDIRAPLEKEHRVLTSCLAKLLSDEGVPSIGMLAGVCSDLMRARRR